MQVKNKLRTLLCLIAFALSNSGRADNDKIVKTELIDVSDERWMRISRPNRFKNRTTANMSYFSTELFDLELLIFPAKTDLEKQYRELCLDIKNRISIFGDYQSSYETQRQERFGELNQLVEPFNRLISRGSLNFGNRVFSLLNCAGLYSTGGTKEDLDKCIDQVRSGYLIQIRSEKFGIWPKGRSS